MNHAYADGVNVFPMFTAFTNEKDFSTLMKFSPAPWWLTLFHLFISPIAILEFAISLVLTP
jgi:hypothetical protein